MKINKKNLYHWFYLFSFSAFVLSAIPLRWLFKTKSTKKTVILYGHKLHGNLLAIKQFFNGANANISVKFLTLDPEYYREQNNDEFLFALNIKDICSVGLADCIISDHGLHSLIFLLFFTNIKFVDVWHGIPFKGFIPEDFRVQKGYSEVWVSSGLLKTLYVEKFGFEEKKVFITGYGRCDTLFGYVSQKAQLKNKYRIASNKKTILFAPTWKQDANNRTEIPFNCTERQFFDALETLAAQQNAVLIIRYHLNTECYALKPDQHLIPLPSSQYPDTEEILVISDILITDWSSIAFDMMALKKPIVFLDEPAPFKNGFSLPPNFRVGPIVSSLKELTDALITIIDDENNYFDQYGEKYREIIQLVYDDTLDGKSTMRYAKRLLEVINR